MILALLHACGAGPQSHFSSDVSTNHSLVYKTVVLTSLYSPRNRTTAPSNEYLLHDLLLLEKKIIAKSFRLAMLSAYDRSNLTSKLNPKLT